jgi:DNA invertase Pin-like site-specific DNA recombinase
MASPKCAIWARVSTDHQEGANQVAQLQSWADRRGFQVVETVQVTESAWQGKHARRLSELVDGARKGRYQAVLVWALDRLSREGPLATLEVVDRLGKAGCQVLSLQEPWTEVSGDLRDLLLAIAGWVARMESQRRSERVRAGLERARQNGKTLGRPKGAKDKGRRSTRGYLLRYA